MLLSKLLIFLLILSLTSWIRLYRLDTFPPALNWDEVSIGYNAYSILKSGRDEWGKFLPLSFRAYGDYKLPLYIYADTPLIALFGLGSWTVRLPSALAGVGTVILIGFIILEFTQNWWLAIFGWFFAAFTPWLIIFSRIGLEANLALFLLTAAFYFFLRSEVKNKFLILSSVLLALSLFTYNSSRVVAVPFLFLIGWLYRKRLSTKSCQVLVSLLIIITAFSLVVPLALLQDSSARFHWTTLLDEGALNEINQLRGSSALPPTLGQLRYNKVTYLLPKVIENYLSHFSPNFLFINGGSNYQYSVPGSGLISWAILPLGLLGTYVVFKERKKCQLLLLGWILISPIPAAITRDAPHALRSLFMIPPLIVISTLGICFVKKRWMIIVGGFLSIVLVMSFFQFWINYTGNYVKNYSWSWQYGYSQVIDFIKQNQDKYQVFFISKKYGEPHEFLLFGLRYDPTSYINDPFLVRYKRSDWYWVDSFSKYRFLNDWEIEEKLKNIHQGVLITSPGNYPSEAQLIQRINFLDQSPAFDIVEL